MVLKSVLKLSVVCFILILSNVSFSQTAEEYYNNGLNDAKAKNYESAITNFSKFIELSPNDPDIIKAYNFRGLCNKYMSNFAAQQNF